VDIAACESHPELLLLLLLVVLTADGCGRRD